MRVLLVAAEALADDVHAERVCNVGRDPWLVHGVRRRERIIRAAVGGGGELDRERVVALERRARPAWRCGEEDGLFLEDDVPADARDGDGRVLARAGVYRAVELQSWYVSRHAQRGGRGEEDGQPKRGKRGYRERTH